MVRKNYFTFLFIFLFIIALFSVAYFTGFLGRITGFANTGVIGMNITIGAFTITSILNSSLTSTLNLGPQSTSYIINFSVYDGAGVQYINDSLIGLNLTLSGETTRQNTTCVEYQTGSNYNNYTCNVTMWWYDGAGNWNITAYAYDNYSNLAINGSYLLTIGVQTAFTVAPANMTWGILAAGASNQTATNDPFNLTNIGNQIIGNGTGNVTINATHLFGETNPSFSIRVGNVTISTVTGGTSCTGTACSECDNYNYVLTNATYVNVTKSVLGKGNYTVGDGQTGQDQLYFCIKSLDATLTQQYYSSAKSGPWTIKIG